MLLILHEDEIPYLDEAVTVFLGRAGRAAPNMIAMVIKNLSARATRAGWPHAPEIVICGDADDPVIREPSHLLPKISRFIISVIDRHQKFLCGDAQLFGHHFPGIGDRVSLEVIAKAEISQHLKERQVPRGHPDVIKVIVFAAGAHAFLACCGAGIIACFNPCEEVFELHHPGVGKHQCGVIAGHQRA